MLLDRLLRNLAMNVEPFATRQIADGSSLRLEDGEWATAHFVLHGTGSVMVRGKSPRTISRASLAIIPHGHVHTLASDLEASGPAYQYDLQGLDLFRAGAVDAPGMVVACGRLQATYGAGLGLFDLLTDAVVLDFADDPTVVNAFETMLAESRVTRPGSDAVLAAAMNQCLVAVFRRLCANGECDLPWLSALEDPHMAPVIDAVLTNPGARHSVRSMAEHASMSRSGFSHKFTQRIGRTPMAWVRDVRLRQAADLLTTTGLSVDAITVRIGFTSRSHFSHAFTDYFELSPTQFRAQRQN